MSGSSSRDARARRTRPKSSNRTRGWQRVLYWPLRTLFQTFDWLFLSPFRLYVSIREQLTPASVTLVVIGITTVNIIWGYPWIGMFAACVALLFVGYAINRITTPALTVDYSLPRSAVARSPFSFLTHVTNQGRLPAMDVQIDVAPPKKPRRRDRKREPLYESLTPPARVPLLVPGQPTQIDGQIVFHRRGLYWMPAVRATNYFPFHLFRTVTLYDGQTSIAITPALMDGDEDEVAKRLLNTLGGWSHRLLAGDALDYTGSREYQHGMAVRRWDFTSWARLGRPIVREFQSPSIRTVLMVVDMCPRNHADDQTEAREADRRSRAEADEEDLGEPTESRSATPMEQDELIERLLSFAATAVTDLCRKRVIVRMVVTHEVPDAGMIRGETSVLPDLESMLIRLAGAQPVTKRRSDRCMNQVYELMDRAPVLVVTSRDEQELPEHPGRNVTVIRVDSASAARPPKMRRKTRPGEEDSVPPNRVSGRNKVSDRDTDSGRNADSVREKDFTSQNKEQTADVA